VEEDGNEKDEGGKNIKDEMHDDGDDDDGEEGKCCANAGDE
jgi:hypothetical protein